MFLKTESMLMSLGGSGVFMAVDTKIPLDGVWVDESVQKQRLAFLGVWFLSIISSVCI